MIVDTEEGEEVAVKVQEMGLTRTYCGIVTGITSNSIFVDDEEILFEFIKAFKKL